MRTRQQWGPTPYSALWPSRSVRSPPGDGFAPAARRQIPAASVRRVLRIESLLIFHHPTQRWNDNSRIVERTCPRPPRTAAISPYLGEPAESRLRAITPFSTAT